MGTSSEMISTRKAGGLPPRTALALVLCLLAGCGLGGDEGEATVSLLKTSDRRLPGGIPAPQIDVPPLSLGNHATLVGYTVSPPNRAAPGEIVDATVFYRCMHRMDGTFSVSGQFIGSDSADWDYTVVSSPRWPVERHFLDQGELFWAPLSFRVPLGMKGDTLTIRVLLKYMDPDSTEQTPLKPWVEVCTLKLAEENGS